MGTSNMDIFKTALSAVVFGLLIAAFSQSCSVSKAGNTILPITNNYKPIPSELKNNLKFSHPVSVTDSPKKRLLRDTVIINKFISITDTKIGRAHV